MGGRSRAQSLTSLHSFVVPTLRKTRRGGHPLLNGMRSFAPPDSRGRLSPRRPKATGRTVRPTLPEASTIAAQESIMSSPTPTPPLDPATSSTDSQQKQPQQQAEKQPAEPQPTPSTEQSKFDIGEEYGTARKNLPPAGILAICIAMVLVIVGVYA